MLSMQTQKKAMRKIQTGVQIKLDSLYQLTTADNDGPSTCINNKAVSEDADDFLIIRLVCENPGVSMTARMLSFKDPKQPLENQTKFRLCRRSDVN